MEVHIVPYPDVNMQIVKQILDCRTALVAKGHFGPFRVVLPLHIADWLNTPYYKEASNENTLLTRILQIDSLEEVAIRPKATNVQVEQI